MSAPTSLEELRDQDQNFPHDIVVGHETALVLFAAGFYGRQDAFWIAEAGLAATCVDSDGDRLADMIRLYPQEWEFVRMDAYEFARSAVNQWDVVTLDPFTNEFQRCADNVTAWCRLADHAVVLGTGTATRLAVPVGWRRESRRRRSDYDGGVYWTVLVPG